MAEPQYLFWLDVESSGLLEEIPRPTILEAAWTITDRDGAQITPLRQRFTALPTLQSPVRTMRGARDYPLHLPSSDGDGGSYWDYKGLYPHAAVREMHDGNHSGLADEWVMADETTPWRVLRDWTELERLWLDDMQLAGMPTEKRSYMLAGGGVSHYEDRFVRTRAPRAFDGTRFHYGLLDVSTVLRAYHVRDEGWPKHADAVLALAPVAENLGLVSTDLGPWRDIDIDTASYDADDSIAVEQWPDTGRDPHRAGIGIARALMAYRLLPELPRWADAGLRLPEPDPADDAGAPDDVTEAADAEAALDAVSR